MTHTWTQPKPAGGSNPLAVKGLPGESFTFTLQMDAVICSPMAVRSLMGIATATGIYSRIAALEMLQFPTGGAGTGGLIGAVSSAAKASAAVAAATGGKGGTKRTVPIGLAPTVLFVWGPERIVPVRVTALTITEKLYDVRLNPIHAEATLTLDVLTPEELRQVKGPLKK